MICDLAVDVGCGGRPGNLRVGVQSAGQAAVLQRQRLELLQIDVAGVDVDGARLGVAVPSASVAVHVERLVAADQPHVLEAPPGRSP